MARFVSWPETQVAELKRLMATRRRDPGTLYYSPSIREIAGMMGLTKGAVVGMVGRLGLTKDERRTKEIAEVAEKPPGKGNFKFATGKEEAAERTKPRTFAHDTSLAPLGKACQPLDHGKCGYVYGDPKNDKDWKYCGRKVCRPGLSWCEGHIRRIYQPATLKKRVG